MKSKFVRLLALPLALMLLLVAAGAGASPNNQGIDGDAAQGESAIYIVQLASPPVASYRGGITGLSATNPEIRGETKLDSKGQDSLAYVAFLEQEQAQFLSAAEQALGRTIEVKYQYQHAYNGVAIRITPAEASAITNLPGVTLVQKEIFEYPLTDAGPTFIGAPGIWDGSDTGGLPGTMGEGVIVGIIDTGINHDNPSFADIGGDGYNHTNPFGSGNYVGYCVSTPSFCNDKLIGAWNYTDGPEDTDGHGSHTASTAAGNVLFDVDLNAPTISFTAAQISGVAPHANIIAYDACQTSCPNSGLLAAINQAIQDGVDVINYSISGSGNPYTDPVEQAFLAAREAGVFVATSAGNAGPGAGTVAHRSPWLTTVAASTHNRAFLASLVNMTGGNTTPPADLHGRSISGGYGPAPIVYAGDYGNALCGPFPANTFNGEIVVCDRGTYGRVEKGQNVLDAGGGGYVLADNVATADFGGLSADPHVLPSVHLTYADGVVLKAWLATGSNHMATITDATMDFDDAYTDVMASFSSRGPNLTLGDIIKPDVSAPGVDILAAYKDGEEHWVISGTSMSSPHTAGAGALLRALHPDWSVAEIQSALMTTSVSDLMKEDAATPADPFDIGAGRIDLSRAGMAGFVLHETLANYQASNPGLGGNPYTLNIPSLGQDNCEGTCSWTRVISSTQSSSVTWTTSYSAPAGMTISVEPSSFTLGAYASRTITITADVSGLTNGVWTFGEVIFTPNVTNPPVPAHFPVAVIANNPDAPVIDVDPDSLESTQIENTVTTKTLTINNLGGDTLSWEIFEELPALGPSGGESWETMAPMPSPRAFHAVVAGGPGLFAIGGSSTPDGLTPSNTNFRYNVSTNSWDTMAPMPASLTGIEGANINGKIYIPGGSTDNNTYVYDIANNSWATIPANNGFTGRQHYGVVAMGTDLYVLGGILGSSSTTQVWKLDTVSETWSAGTPMQKSRINFAAAAIGGEIYVAGGVAFPGFTPDMTAEKFNGTSWSYIAPVPDGGGIYTRWSYLADGNDNGKLWLAAGRRDTDWNVLNHTGVYNPDDDSWTTSPTLPTLSTSRVYLDGAVASDGYFYVVGGRDSAASILFDQNERLLVTTVSACSDEDIPWLSVDPSSGTTPGGGSDEVSVVFDSTGLSAGEYTGNLCISSNDPNNATVVVPVTLTVVEGGDPAIILAKSVGTDLDSCASTTTITVTAGTEVAYCYKAINIGTVTFNTHDLEDSHLGTLLNDYGYELAPGAYVEITATAVITENTVNTATWTAYDSFGQMASAEASATVNVEEVSDNEYRLYMPVAPYSAAESSAAGNTVGEVASWLPLTLPFLIVGMGFSWQQRRKSA